MMSAQSQSADLPPSLPAVHVSTEHVKSYLHDINRVACPEEMPPC